MCGCNGRVGLIAEGNWGAGTLICSLLIGCSWLESTQSHGGTQRMEINEISGAVVDSAMQVHTLLGPGLLEATY